MLLLGCNACRPCNVFFIRIKKNNDMMIWYKIKNTIPWTYVINDLNGEEITGSFYEKELQKN